MTVVSNIPFRPGQAAWLYFTFTNPDAITTDNPNGLVDADPVTVQVMDVEGDVTSGTADHISLGFYRYLVQFVQGGGNYLVVPQGQGLGYTNDDVVIPVGRSPF